ncbi:MAG: thiamine phosphate synthase [Muribaculaceae bacterium]|nr:thiamine phosphate synthase [Muribaculaceae bacterium]
MLQYITHTADNLEAVLKGGCRWVQLRIKDATDAEYLAQGNRVGQLCRRYGAKFIVDDRVHLVAQLDADGVHLGKNDMPLPQARRLLQANSGIPRYRIIGATANTADDIIQAADAGADYIGLGPLRFTSTKKNLAPLIGIEGYGRIMARCRSLGITLPVVAIGGITTADLAGLKLAGVDGVAVSGFIATSENPELTTRNIIDIWEN